MPSRSSLSPGAVPCRLAGFLCLPQGEILVRFLVCFHVQPLAGSGFPVFHALPAQLSVSRKCLHAVIHVSGGHGIGVSVFNQPADQLDNLRNVFRRLGVHGRRPDAQRLGVRVVFADEALRQFLHGDAFLVGPADHLVVDVRKILYEGHFVSFPFQLAAKHIKSDERPGVPDMEIIVYRRPAGINADLSLVYRFEFFLFPAQAVINLHIRSPLFFRN